MASHVTHLILAAGLCILLILLLVFRRRLVNGRSRAVGQVAVIVALVAAAHLALHTYLYGAPSLNGEGQPFLMARLIADGPGRWHLAEHCREAGFAICEHVHDLPDNSRHFPRA